MDSISKIISWRATISISIAVLALLIVFDFYGLYTGTFYFLKADNYIFPIATLVHFIFLYVLKFKIEEDEMTDAPMRTIEYMLYAAFLIYLFKTVEIIYTIATYEEFSNYVLPGSFLPLGGLILVLHVLLLALTLLAVHYRKRLVGEYNLDTMGQHIDSWE
ncbi:hypothetical protein RQM65_18170 [Pricia sp. S334]|uniref:Uncharacterized protein n=1 Tax=Pricia mediterranea TaxID=3076079 RepID=A0ABU3LA27_9FLAO|nr:hypothetical protein [Pricia sp. S334]MDT7830601.1 hypothetical protein [Pricia sp. S334]